MATIEQRGPNAWRVYWRLGGRGGAKQSCTFATWKTAVRADEIAKAHRHEIIAEDVYQACGFTLGDDVQSPTLADWASVWLECKTRITTGTANSYRAQFDREILPALGDKQLHEITGTDVARLINRLRSCDCQPAAGQLAQRGSRCGRGRRGGHGL